MNASMSFKKWLGTPVIFAVALGLFAVVPTLAQKPSKDKGNGNDMKHFGEITKDAEHLGGFFDIYEKKDKVYLEIPVDRLGEEILLIQSLSRGIGDRGILGGMPTEIFDGQIVKFERHHDRIYLVQVNHRFMAPEGTPAGAAVDLSFGNSILASLPIVSERHEGDEVGVVPDPPEEEKKDKEAEAEEDESSEDEKAGEGDEAREDEASNKEAEQIAASDEADEADDADADAEEEEPEEEPKVVISVVVDYAKVLISDLPNLTEGINEGMKAGFKLDQDRSYVESIKVFPRNAEFNMELGFTSGKQAYLPTVIDSRYMTIGLHHSYSELPKEPMRGRYADPRMGYFLSVYKDYSRNNDDTFFVRHINRWRLEKQNPNAEVSKPVKQIVYYIENTWPVEYRKYVKRGIEAWQKSFEAAGFKNAIVAKPQPDDPDWAAEDVRYSTIRYITTYRPSFGAIGPSRVDPRTGEILDADILFDANQIQGLTRTFQRLTSVAAPPGMDPFEYLLESDQIAWDEAIAKGGIDYATRMCVASQGLGIGAALAGVALVARGDIRPGGEMPEEFVGQAITWITMHEVGHTLGLRHNFKSSMSCPYDKLHDKSWVKRNGLYGSVMEYPTPNLAATRADQGYYYSPVVGTADDWVIRYGYSEFKKARSSEDEVRYLTAIAAESTDPLHYYGPDEDSYMIGATDAFTNTYDLGDDPMAWSRDRTAYIASLYPGLEDKIVGEGDSWSDLTNAFSYLLINHYRSVRFMARYVAGMSTSRSHRGDPDARDPMVMLDPGIQREAIQYIADELFTDEPFRIPDGWMQKLEPERWTHWGSRFSGRADFPFYSRIASMQRPIIDRLTHPVVLTRVLDSEMHQDDAFTLVELFDTMDRAIWTEVQGATASGVETVKISTIRRSAQRLWLDRMIEVAFIPAPGTPYDARAVARMNLVELVGQIDNALDSGALMDGYTKAHLMDCHARALTAIESGYQLEVMKGRSAGTSDRH